MTDRVFQNEDSFEVSSRHGDVEIYVYDDHSVKVNVSEGGGQYDAAWASFTMTAEEATKMKEFLISKGY